MLVTVSRMVDMKNTKLDDKVLSTVKVNMQTDLLLQMSRIMRPESVYNIKIGKLSWKRAGSRLEFTLDSEVTPEVLVRKDLIRS